MKSFLFTLLMLCSVFAFAQEEQSSNTPINQGDFLVGATQISGTSISDIAFSPSVGCAITDQIVLGVSSLRGGGGDWSAGIFGRYYLDSPFFAGASLGYNSNTEDAQVGIAGGITGFVCRTVFFEPVINIAFGDETTFGLALNLGIRF